MPNQSELDAQFNESDLERRVQDLETKLSQYEQGGFDLFRQFGYLQLGLNLPRLDQNGIQQVATAAGSAGIGTQGFWIVPKFSPKPGQINETSPVMPRSGLTGYADSATPRAAMYMASDGVLNETSARVHTKADNSGAEAGLYAASTDGMTNLSIALTLLALDSDSTAGRLTLYDAFMNFATVAATFANPSEGDIWYDTTANKFYGRNNSATLELGGSSGGGVATDVIWDAKGDLAVGTGADTASKLAYPATNGRHIYSYTSAATGLTWDNFFGTSTSSNGSGSAPVLDGAHRMIYTESLSGARTIPVRAASTLGDGDMVSLKNFSADTQTLTVNVNGGGTIDGQTTLNLGYKEGVILAAGNNKWFVMSREQPTYWIHLTADYTLTSTTAAQKIFNTTTNGQVALPPGVYEFECFLYLTTMSGTSGNAMFTLGGTATKDRIGFHVTGIDNSNPLNAGTRTGSASVTTASVASMVSAGTGTGMTSLIEGIFRVSAGGTLIPQISLVTAAAAVVKAGSWFKCRKIGESAQTYNGAWT